MDTIYQYLKEHDAQWLEETLHQRARLLLDGPQTTTVEDAVEQLHISEPEQPKQTAIPSHIDTSPSGPFDVTQEELPPGLEISDHVRFIRQHDWANTALGPMSQWPTALRRFANMMLADNRAACLWWGPQRLAIYNETYVHIAAHRHPGALGSPVNEVWPELVDAPFGHAYDHADQTGKPSAGERAQFFVAREGYLEELWASWEVLPIPGPGGNLGYYNSATEVTQEMLNNRRMETLQSLDQYTALSANVNDFWGQVIRALEDNPFEAPFVAMYGPASSSATNPRMPPITAVTSSDDHDDLSSVSQDPSMFAGTEWTLEGVYRASLAESLPTVVDMDTGCELLTPTFRSAMSAKTIQVLTASDMAPTLFKAAKSRVWDQEQCNSVILLPIWSSFQEHRSGFLLLGLNPRRPYDDDYKRFIRIFHHQLTTSLSSIVTAEEEAKRARAVARLAAKDRIRLVEKLAATEHEAQLSELRFRSMADLAPIGIFEFDTSGTLLYANQCWIALTGYAPESAHKGMAMSNALVEADRDAFSQEWQKLFHGEEIHFECRLDRPFKTNETYAGERLEGETWVLITAYALRDESIDLRAENITCVFGCLVDISRQKWMEGFQERRFREQNERRRQQETFMDTTSHEARNPLAAITLCADDLNSTMCDLLHKHEDQLVVSRQTAAAVLDSIETIMSCARHQKRIIDDVLTFSKLDSGMLLTSPSPVQPTGVLKQALKMFKTEVKRSDVELGYLIGPSYTELAVKWVMLDPTRFLQVLVNLLNNAIKFTKQDSSRKITITLDASTTRPDAEDVGVNFAPFAARRASIVPSAVSYSVEPAVTLPESVYLLVSIRDSGPGILQEELDKLFQRFQQASPKTYAQYGGSGLGLWISKELCAKLGGQIGVASRAGQGSTFAFYVQAARCEPPPAEQRHLTSEQNYVKARQVSVDEVWTELSPVRDSPAVAAKPLPVIKDTAVADANTSAQLSILVVEDNLINQKVMRKQLLHAGFKVTVANHGVEALDAIYTPVTTTASSFDVILMDIEMPVMGGLECTRAIRSRETDAHYQNIGSLPILGVTANARAEQQAAALDAGMDLVVTKPFHMSDLLAAIEKVRVEKKKKRMSNGSSGHGA
ncbi:Putative PAS domain, signal transduction response regulator, receiver domain, CheY-like superfamily [Septoria linicola]|uniref:histidine kinase n=1 Tax=Septoria linicola TaxID=215465 RepID=A0A9Q9EPN5_9PEZI|nr:putative PAS domain, signal transduction response regulator, receiver domain, CheY-like superfamily [Septoria linicola]USW58951.1 Putative PAS domain, signal transduction response regulator, receiver domain, CheY-like superfamily [Septoria linicola]